MTNEEAIKILTEVSNSVINNRIVVALDRAIKALTAIDTMQKIVDGDVETIMRILKEREE